MDYRDTAEEARFRSGLRSWLAASIPPGWEDVTDARERAAIDKRWQQALYRAGYMGMSWPPEYGGRGLSPVYDAILVEEMSLADAPPFSVNVNYLGRAMWTHGTEEQKRRFLPMILSGDAMWCQGFSEPEAGSDLGSLRTRAVLDGGEWVVNGRKLWTSRSPTADWCLLLARTEPDVAKHEGISCLLLSMDTPGVEARPVYLSNGEPATGEVYFDGARVPADQLLGARGDGWKIALTALAVERGPGDVGYISKYQRSLRELEALTRSGRSSADPELRRRLAAAYVRGEAMRLTYLEQLSSRAVGHPTGPEGSVAKLLWAEAEQTLNQVAMDLFGADSLTGREPRWLSQYLYSRASSVYGGTAQIQKNILARRVLRLPR
jgi:alkylation response protein AidB-like acyl-CoA dehydrogenase